MFYLVKYYLFCVLVLYERPYLLFFENKQIKVNFCQWTSGCGKHFTGYICESGRVCLSQNNRLGNVIIEVAEWRIEATQFPVPSVWVCRISSPGWKAISNWAALTAQSSAPSKCLRLQLPKPFAQSDQIYFQTTNESHHYTMAGPHLEHADRRCTSTDHLYDGGGWGGRGWRKIDREGE